MRGISKNFGAVQALERVDIEVAQGEIHALVGENGAGKTTLMRILYGAIQLDTGDIEIEGKSVRFHSAADGINAGIGMVSQHYSIIGELSCLENLMLGAEPGAWISKETAKNRAEELAQKMGFDFDWERDASTLSPGGAQKLEILKLLWRNARIMILDEPTAMLSPADSDALFESLKQLTSEGATVILVTHRLPEVLEHCERVTVLRAGRLIDSKRVGETNARELAEMIVGHPIEDLQERSVATQLHSILEVENLIVIGSRLNEAVKQATFHVKSGEVVGIAGVDGSGQRELFWALMGVSQPSSGSIRFVNEDVTGKPASARLLSGMRLIPEDRHEEGAVDDWPLEMNAALSLQRLAPFSKNGRVDRTARKQLAVAMADRFSARYSDIGAPLASLSGGNQQRFVAARALALDPKLILAFQPARGLDIDATRAVYAGIRDACEKGAGALVVSFDLDELLEQCDRIIVMNLGRVLHPKSGEEQDRSAIGRLMVGAE